VKGGTQAEWRDVGKVPTIAQVEELERGAEAKCKYVGELTITEIEGAKAGTEAKRRDVRELTTASESERVEVHTLGKWRHVS
jgi:hypothetical protein